MARKQFSKGLRSKTGVRQRPKNTQKNFFDKQRPGTNFPGLSKISSTGDSVSIEMMQGPGSRKGESWGEINNPLVFIGSLSV